MAVVALLVACVVSYFTIRVIERWASRLGLIDTPNQRSSHLLPRPRGGGIGIAAGAFVAAGLLALQEPFDTGLLALLAAAAVVAAVGLWDDVADVAPGVRLVVHVASAGVVVAANGGLTQLPLPAPLDLSIGPVGGALLAVVWMVGVTNFFNFMDGADGLAGGQAVLTFAAAGVVLWPSNEAALALLVAAATVGFLFRNRPPAHIFLGDVGSGWLGFLMAGLPFVLAPGPRESLVLLVAVSMTLFLTDPVLTLVRRWRGGGILTESHREHAYQRLFVPGESHARVVGLILAGGALLSVLAILAWYRPGLGWPVITCAVMATLVEWRAAAQTSGHRTSGHL